MAKGKDISDTATLPPHYAFRDPQLGVLALTHRSHGPQHNERLEWLGDAVVGYEVSRLLYRTFPQMAEGALSQMRSKLVARDALAQVARRLHLGDYARLGAKGMHAGRENVNLLANLLEAYAAAVYLDGGDVGELVQEWMAADMAQLAAQAAAEGIASLRDAKTQLQEYLQQRKRPPPTYTLQRQTGAAGEMGEEQFVAECIVNARLSAHGSGTSRREAEGKAAAICLQQLKAADGKKSKGKASKTAGKKGEEA